MCAGRHVMRRGPVITAGVSQAVATKTGLDTGTADAKNKGTAGAKCFGAMAI